MKHLLSLTLLLVGFGSMSYAQDYKFGKVSKAELTQTHYAKDSMADAAILYRSVNISYSYIKDQGFQVNTKIHERVKIYTQKGFEFGTKSESLYKNGSAKEDMVGIKAVTYNLVDGEIEKIKLKGSDAFSENTSKNWSKKKFTMPNLKEGSVVEYVYTLSSPFSYSLDEIQLQYDIPIALQKIRVAIPEYFVFKKQLKGYLFIETEEDMSTAKINFSSFNRNGYQSSISSANVDYKIAISTVDMADVPALKEEPYVNNMDNYRSALIYELQYVKFPNSPLKDYTGSWEKVVKTIYESESFGNQLDSKRYFKNDLPSILQGKSTDIEKMDAVFQFVKNRMHWNDIYGYFVDEGVKKAYELKTGNIADINLILISMLREAGLTADPVLVSTRSNGVPIFPTRRGFNYVVAVVQLDEGKVFLDATNKYSKPNMLPTRTINWAGRIVKEGGTSLSVSLIPENVSQEQIMLNAALSPEGEIKGKMRRTNKDYKAYSYRNNYAEMEEESYLESLEESYNGLEIADYSIKNEYAIGKPITQDFSFVKENAFDIIGSKMYVSPLLWFTISENPFTLEKRDYPIDFTYPWAYKYIITLKIPEGYEVESVPEKMNISMEGRDGRFLFNVGLVGKGSIQITAELKMNKAVIPSINYQGLKEFYKAVIEKQSEKIVLSKKSGEGDANNASGGH